jgi:hypothetical protein
MLAAAITLFGSRERIVQATDAVLDGHAGEQRCPIDIQGLHGPSAVVIHRIWGQIEDAGGFLDGAAEADEADNFTLAWGQSGDPRFDFGIHGYFVPLVPTHHKPP